MTKSLGSLVALLIGLNTFTVDAACGNRNTCMIKWYSNTTKTASWNLCNLCREPGSEYSVTDVNNHTFYFNIGSDVSQLCTPPWTVYASHGVFTYFWTPAPKCPTPPDGTCRDPENGNNAVCCTGDCFTIPPTSFTTAPLAVPLYTDEKNPSTITGVSLNYVGLPPDSSDPFGCPTDPITGCSKNRYINFNILCDPNGSTKNLTYISLSEPATCGYTLTLSSKAACPKLGHFVNDQEVA